MESGILRQSTESGEVEIIVLLHACGEAWLRLDCGRIKLCGDMFAGDNFELTRKIERLQRNFNGRHRIVSIRHRTGETGKGINNPAALMVNGRASCRDTEWQYV